jgi:hypothetical protein
VSLSTDARQEIAQLLNAAGIQTWAEAPATVSLPSVVITPDSPYIYPNRVGKHLAYQVNLSLKCSAMAADNAIGLATVEALIDDILKALPASVNVTAVNAPSTDDLGAQGNVITADISITAQVTERA